MTLDGVADVAAIFTAAVAGIAYGRYRIGLFLLKRRFEALLGAQSPKYMDELIQELWMSEKEIFEAARGSRVVQTGIDPGAAPIAARLWFRYKPNSN